jgi:hypothetical protein
MMNGSILYYLIELFISEIASRLFLYFFVFVYILKEMT